MAEERRRNMVVLLEESRWSANTASEKEGLQVLPRVFSVALCVSVCSVFRGLLNTEDAEIHRGPQSYPAERLERVEGGLASG